jgi:hypothetical protein
MRLLCFEIRYVGLNNLHETKKEIRALLRAGKLARAVKVYRAATGETLGESLDAVKRIGRRMRTRWRMEE